LESKLAESVGPERAKEMVDSLVWSKMGPDLLKFFEASQKVIEARNKLVETIPAGTFEGDLLRVEEYKDIEAAKRLAAKYFPRKALFQDDRWTGLRPFFLARILETDETDMVETDKKDWDTVWNEISVSALFLVLTIQRPENATLVGIPFHRRDRDWQKQHTSIWHWLRNELRKEIERDLLYGATSDSSGHRNVENIIVSETQDDSLPGSAEIEAQIIQELSILPERIDTIRGLSEALEPLNIDTLPGLSKALDSLNLSEPFDSLNLNDRLVLLADWAGYTDEELATQFGISEEAFRKRKQLVREKIRVELKAPVKRLGRIV
jgi:hypothetical protein